MGRVATQPSSTYATGSALPNYLQLPAMLGQQDVDDRSTRDVSSPSDGHQLLHHVPQLGPLHVVIEQTGSAWMSQHVNVTLLEPCLWEGPVLLGGTLENMARLEVEKGGVATCGL